LVAKVAPTVKTAGRLTEDRNGPAVSPSVPALPEPGTVAVPGLVSGPLLVRRDATPDDPLGGAPVDGAVTDALRRRRGGGTPLPAELAGAFGQHFGQDLSGVRVHQDGEAGTLARSLQSTAFTHGTDVYFAPGAYRPGTEGGRRLIAHELSHVVHQRTGEDRAAGGVLSVGRANDPAEAAADRSADIAMSALRRSTAQRPSELEHGISDSSAPVRRSLTPIGENHPLRRDGTPLLGGHRVEQPEQRQNSMSSGTGGFAGTESETTSVGQSRSDRSGGFTGTRTETTHKAVTGTWSQGVVSQEVRNGLSTRTTETSHDHLAGAEAWAKTITECSDAQLLAAFQARARAGAFSKGSGSTSYQRGVLSTGASGSYDAMAGVDTGVSGHAKVDTSGLIPALEAAAAAYAKGGVGLDAEASVFARLWKLEFVATGKVSLFAGFEASAQGRAFLNMKEGIGAEGSVSGFAGVRGELSGSASLSLGPAELIAMASVEGKAGAWASASGKVAISFTGVEVTGSAEAFAGVTASATGSSELKFRGKSLFSASGTVTAAAGIGGKVSGTFVLKGGKLKVNLGVLAVKGIGGGFELSGEVDLYALGEAICTKIWEQYANYVNEVTEDAGYIPRDVLIDPEEAAKVEQLAYDAYIYDFRSYAAEKLGGSGSTGLNRDRVQKILTDRRGQLGTALTHVEADLGMVKAAKEAFGPLLGDIVIQAGVIRGWSAVGGSGIGAVREEHAKKAATDSLRAALVAGAVQTRSAGGKSGGPTHAPDFAAVNKVLGKHGPTLIGAFGTDTVGADAAIAALVEEVYGGFWSHVVVTGGKLSSAKTDLQAISRADAEAAQTRSSVARVTALAQLQSACATYAAEQAKSAKARITKEKVAVIIGKHAGPVTGSGQGEVADRVITDMVIRGLGPSIKTFIYSAGEIRAFEAADPAEVNRAYLADADAKRRKGLYDKAKEDFAAYIAEKTKSGENGVKQARVQKIVDGVVKKVGPDNLAEADAALTAAGRDALASMINYFKVEQGTVVMVASQTKAAGLKDAYAKEQQNRGRFLGEDEANERRYTVRRLVYGPIRSYAAAIRGDAHGVPTLTEIQRVVDDALGSRSDVLTMPDAREYLVQLIIEVFDGVVSITADDSGRLIRPVFDMTRLQQLRDKDSDRAASREALGALRSPLRSYAGKTAKGRPTLDGIQQAIDPVLRTLSGLQPDELDRLIQMAVMEAFGSSRIKAVEFSGGRITMLKLAR
jgi:hypothetical protein